MRELSLFLRRIETVFTRQEMRALTLLLFVGALIVSGCGTQAPSADQVVGLHVQQVQATATAWAENPGSKADVLAQMPERYLAAVVQTQSIATNQTGTRRANCGGIVLAEANYMTPAAGGGQVPVNMYEILDLDHCLNIENPQNSADVMPANKIMLRTATEYDTGKPGHATTIMKTEPLVDLSGKATEIEVVTVMGEPGDTIPGMVPYGFDHFASNIQVGATGLKMQSFPSEAVPISFVDADMTYTGVDPDTGLAIIHTQGAKGTSASAFVDANNDLAGFMTRESNIDPNALMAVTLMKSAAAQASFDWDVNRQAVEQKTVGLQP